MIRSHLITVLLAVVTIFVTGQAAEPTQITHGPILGHVTEDSVRIWARTARPANVVFGYVEDRGQPIDQRFFERYQPPVGTTFPKIATTLDNDNCGWTTITGLSPGTKYWTVAYVEEGKYPSLVGSFRTLPAAAQFRDTPHNPEGRFNFKFEFGSCASQNPVNGIGSSLPTYSTMLREVKDDVAFAIMNGDWLYEEKRQYPVDAWLWQQGVTADQLPAAVKFMPTLVGLWENYKAYLSRGVNLAEWHRHVPSYFTFDDHELVNDIWGAGTAGRVDRRAVFRDIGTVGWYDYLGWADPVAFSQDVVFGHSRLNPGDVVLFDPEADFTALDLKQIANLHIHWGTPSAGEDDISLDQAEQAAPNAGVYDVVKIIDKNRIQITPPARASGQVTYTIGRRSYSKFTVGNCDFFLLDTRSHRQWHDTSHRDKPGLSILGDQQREWLMESMSSSKADFFFICSSVPFMIPHIGAGGHELDAANKDESWTVFVDEREKLIAFWETLEKPTFVLTGDLHNSFAIKITDRVWEFCSGPHNSVNHTVSDEGNRPATGLYQFDKRQMDIRWSTRMLNDIPRSQRLFPNYCVAQINNVYNNPLATGDERWVAYEHPQVIFQYFDGYTGDLKYAEAISTRR